MTEAQTLTRECVDGVLRITINRPDMANSLTAGMREQLVAWLEEASWDLKVRVVVLAGSGTKGFCTGADLSSSSTPVLDKPEGAPERAVGDAARLIRTGWQRLVAAILDCEKPVIAEVNATAAGGGMHLALACDLVVMAESAKFISVFVRRGIAPDAGGAWMLSRLIGPQRAKELFFFGDAVKSEQALALGLVNAVVADEQLRSEVDALATRLASGPTKAIAQAKALVNRAMDLADEANAQELVVNTEDMREGVAAFLERRDPEFRGW
jgi:2-(1,2-epoxy-1,2-dihydrophenyl)acetyl-CoA isomerase